MENIKLLLESFEKIKKKGRRMIEQDLDDTLDIWDRLIQIRLEKNSEFIELKNRYDTKKSKERIILEQITFKNETNGKMKYYTVDGIKCRLKVLFPDEINEISKKKYVIGLLDDKIKVVDRYYYRFRDFLQK